jgi:hypothetical protein
MTTQHGISDRGWCAQRLAAGDTVASIARACDVSRQTASAWLKRHGLRANHQPYDRPDTAALADAYVNARSMRKLATHYRISPAAMRTWLFEAGIEPLGTSGRPQLDLDLDDLRARRVRGDTWKAIANDLGVAPETLRRRIARAP